MSDGVARYWRPDTSDKLDDECWPDYWDRKRHERHGDNCQCPLCANETELNAMTEKMGRLGVLPGAGHSWCQHTYVGHPDIVGDDGAVQ